MVKTDVNKQTIFNIINIIAMFLFMVSAVLTWGYKMIPLNKYIAIIAISLTVFYHILNGVWK